MIDELHAENVALIRNVTIEPATGLTVLTGETGTGKTALLSALKLLIGERADANTIREGAEELVVEGRFFITADANDDGVIVRRRIDGRGRGRVSIDGRMASVHELADGIGSSVDLCGQHEHQRLLRRQTHVELLDTWAKDGISDARRAYRNALVAAREATSELERIRRLAQTAAERADEARFVLGRIDEVGPNVEELTELEDVLPKAAHAESLLRATQDAHHQLTGDNGIIDSLGQVVVTLEDAAHDDVSLDAFATSLRSALLDMEDVAQSLRGYQDSIDTDPYALEALQARMSAYQGLMRAYGPRLEDVLARRDEAKEIVGMAEDSTTSEQLASKAVAHAELELAKAAKTLDSLRREAAPLLANAISKEMSYLEMGSASVEFVFADLPRAQWDKSGPTRIELLYRPSAGMSARPLRKIASGGEISRVMLACKVVLGNDDSTSTLIFDEVDAGVGGATAIALSNMLDRLARTHQVIVVTHLAQVAVRAMRHYVVKKRPSAPGDPPETIISEVTGDDRVAEIARMLSGDTQETALVHARHMLSQYQTA